MRSPIGRNCATMDQCDSPRATATPIDVIVTDGLLTKRVIRAVVQRGLTVGFGCDIAGFNLCR